MCPVTRFFSVETNLSFWWDLEKFSQKSVPSHTFLRCGDYLKFLRGLGKFRQKDVPSYTFFFRCGDLTWVFDGTWKNFHKKVCPVTRFFAVETILSFWWDLESFDKNVCPVKRFFSLWRLTWVFDGTWKNFHKKVCPVTRFFAVETISSFWWDLESFDKNVCPVTRFFSLWRLTWVFDGTWKKFHKKVCPVICFFAVETISSFWWDLEKFPQKCVPSYTFFLCGD